MTYLKFITLYKQNSLAKKKYYEIEMAKNNKKILIKFIELGLIKHVFGLSKNKHIIRIYINYINNEKMYKSLVNYYKPSQKKSLNLKTLNIKKNFKSNSVLLLSTSIGILTNFEAIQFKQGGILLCQINY